MHRNELHIFQEAGELNGKAYCKDLPYWSQIHKGYGLVSQKLGDIFFSQLRDISRWNIWDSLLLENRENLWCISVLAPVRRSFFLSNWYHIVRDQNRCSVNPIWLCGPDWAVMHPAVFENWVNGRKFSNQASDHKCELHLVSWFYIPLAGRNNQGIQPIIIASSELISERRI